MKMHLNVNHTLLNNNIQKRIFSKPCCDTQWYYVERHVIMINVQFIYSQNKILESFVDFEIKSQTLNMFQLHKKCKIYYLKKNCNQLLWFKKFYPSWFTSNMQALVYCHKLNHFFFFLFFSPYFLCFFCFLLVKLL